MKKKTIIILSCLAILIIVIAFVIFYMVTNRPTPSTMVYIDPQTISGTLGQNFTINISISNVIDLYGWELKLRWNAAILDVVNVTEGPFLKSHDETFFFPQIVNEAGYLVLDCTLLGDVSGVNGSGVLATMQFHVKESGSCDLPLYYTMLIDSAERTITHTVRNGRFST